ncbi:histidine kinase [Taibaiella sp. KBW10]|uniref:sensor histidine kinase n=1 Tax=Taibaiella sp. KBW10 TaxID=2153357 RepID=UPI0013157058|nr:histidine kinase [Taibaiella sp. KBW10]
MFIGILAGIRATAQFNYAEISQGKKYINYTEGAHKLASNVCYKLQLDDQGYLWVATDRGLQVYNGNDFESIDIPGYDGEIVCLFKDGAYLIGMSYYGDIIHINTQTRKIALLRNYNPPWDQPNNTFKNFLRIKDRLYFLRYFGQSFFMPATDFYQRETDKFKNIHLFSHKKEFINVIADALKEKYQIESPSMLALLPEWVNVALHKMNFYEDGFSSGKNYAYRAKTAEGDSSWAYYQNNHVRKGDYILGVLNVNNEKWIAWRFYGLEILKKDERTAVFAPFAHHLNGICVSGLVKDGQGNIWLSTLSNGLLRISPAEAQHYYDDCTDKRLYYEPDICYLNVKKDRIITGYRRPVADVLWRKQDKIDRVSRYIAGTNTDNSKTKMMLVNPAGKGMLISDEGNLYTFTDAHAPGKLSTTVVKDAYEEAEDYIAIVKRTFFLQINKDKFQLDTIPVKQAAINPYNLILAKCSAFPDSGYYIANTTGLYLNDKRIIYGADFRALKLRNYEGNIVLLNSQQIWIKPLGQANFELLKNISGNDVKQIDWDEQTRMIYVLTNTGILQYNIRTKNGALFLSNEEMPDDAKMNCFSIDTHYLWIGMTKGIIKVQKDKLSQRLSFPLFIRQLSRKNNSPLADTLRYTYSAKLDIPLVVDILDFNTEKYNIIYEVYDQDDKLFKKGSADKAHILNIGLFRPGTYRIKVSAFQIKGYLTKELVLMISPLWWQRLEVQVAGFLMVLAMVILITTAIIKRRSRQRYIHLKNQHELLLVKNKLQSSRLKPHFIFNALNPLQKYILEDNKENALQYFEHFSKLMRNSIKNFDVDFTTLEEELVFIKQYIYVQECRYPGKFSVITDFHLLRKPGAIKLPAMILQPIFENAIEHGFSEEKDAVNIIGFSIVENRDDHTLTIIIENSGSRFEGHVRPNENRGLGIVAHKMALIAAQFGQGTITFANGAMGAQCKFILPLDIDQRLKK